MELSRANPVVHLELRTGDLSRASAFYSRLFALAPGADRDRLRLLSRVELAKARLDARGRRDRLLAAEWAVVPKRRAFPMIFSLLER